MGEQVNVTEEYLNIYLDPNEKVRVSLGGKKWKSAVAAQNNADKGRVHIATLRITTKVELVK